MGPGTLDNKKLNKSINISSLRTLSKNLVISARNEIRRTKLSEESRGMEVERKKPRSPGAFIFSV